MQRTSNAQGLLLVATTTSYSTVMAGVLHNTLVTGQDVIRNPADGPSIKSDRTHSYAYFHLVFATASMYIGMLLTNWMSATGYEEYGYDQGYVAMWIKTVAAWLTSLLYIWSLLGPIFLPDRDWS